MAMNNLSGAIISGGSSQLLADTNTKRHGFILQNRSNGNLYINFISPAGTSATDGNFEIASGTYWEMPFFNYNADETTFGGYDKIYIYGATTGQQFTAMEW